MEESVMESATDEALSASSLLSRHLLDTDPIAVYADAIVLYTMLTITALLAWGPLISMIKRLLFALVERWVRRRSSQPVQGSLPLRPAHAPPLAQTDFSDMQYEDILAKRNPFTSTRILPRSPPQKSAIKAPQQSPLQASTPGLQEIHPSQPPPPPPLFLFPLSPLPRSLDPLVPPDRPGPSQWTVSKKEVMERRAQRALQQNNTPSHLLPPQTKPQSSTKGKGLGLFFSATRPKSLGVEEEIKRQIDEEREREEEARTSVHSPSLHSRSTLDHKGQGWPGWLLEQTDSQLASIRSVQGLEASDEFRTWSESRKGSALEGGPRAGVMSPYVNTPRRREEAFKALRHADPNSFKSLMSRPEIIDGETTSPNRFLLCLEYLVTSTISLVTLVYAISPHLSSDTRPLVAFLRLLPLVTWARFTMNAWMAGHTSAFGSLFGHYLVSQDRAYPLHYHSAGLLKGAIVGLIEITFLGGTLFLGGLGVTLIKLALFPPWTSDRIGGKTGKHGGTTIRSWRTVGQAAMGLVVIRQIDHRRSISTFPPSGLHSNKALKTPFPLPRAYGRQVESGPRVLSGSGWMARGGEAVSSEQQYSWGKMYQKEN